MGKKPIISVTYENERISIKKKNSLPLFEGANIAQKFLKLEKAKNFWIAFPFV